MQAENQAELRKLAELHGDLDAIARIQASLRCDLRTPANPYGITFEGKKHLWNALSRLTSRVESSIISNRELQRELIHLAAKAREGAEGNADR